MLEFNGRKLFYGGDPIWTIGLGMVRLRLLDGEEQLHVTCSRSFTVIFFALFMHRYNIMIYSAVW